MKSFNLIGAVLLGVFVGSLAHATATEPSVAKPEPLGIAAIAPTLEALGTGWTERKIVFAIDPLDQPSETVNEAASRDASNRSRLLANLRTAMERDGVAGRGYFGYGFGNLGSDSGRYDLHLSRYPDQKSLEKRWSGYARQADNRPGLELGEAAVWLTREGSDADFRLVFKQGLYIAQLDCTSKQKPELLVLLAKVVSSAMDKATNLPDTPKSASPCQR